MTKFTKEEYLNDPCMVSSLPFWKTKTFSIPESIQVIRDDLYKDGYQNDCRYFKMLHRLNKIGEAYLPTGFVIFDASINEYVHHINSCYEEEHVEDDELEQYKCRPTYNSKLWIAIKDINTNVIVATAIGEVDLEINEGSLEWIQVSKEYRKRGLGTFLVNSLLIKMKPLVDFVTVSGRIDNPTNPMQLYKTCGFENCVIWHVVRNI